MFHLIETAYPYFFLKQAIEIFTVLSSLNSSQEVRKKSDEIISSIMLKLNDLERYCGVRFSKRTYVELLFGEKLLAVNNNNEIIDFISILFHFGFLY